MLSRLPDAFGADSLSRYFTAATLLFIVSFLFLPSSKMVNNLFYLSLALPAIVILPRYVQSPGRVTWVGWLWLVFLGYFAYQGVAVGDFSFLKHVAYVALFVFILACLVKRDALESDSVARALFWGSIAYVLLNAVWLWSEGASAPGERVLWLSGRMAGPIYTSMWIAVCFALCVPMFIERNKKAELVVALLAALFVCGYVLQSRSGLVGLFICMLPLAIHLSRRVAIPRALLWLPTVAVVIAVYFLVDNVPAVTSLWARGDSYRLELWASYADVLSHCGVWQGCGVDFAPVIQLPSGMTINHPHNVYLSLALYGGLPGAVLFLILMGTLLFTAARTRSVWGLVLGLGLVMVNFDGHRVLDSPNELWLLILLPAGLLSSPESTLRTSSVES